MSDWPSFEEFKRLKREGKLKNIPMTNEPKVTVTPDDGSGNRRKIPGEIEQ